MNRLDLARYIQYVVGQCLTSDVPFTDVEEWKELQVRLVTGLNTLEEWRGDTPDEEAERLLAILMGHCVSVGSNRCMRDVLVQAEKVLPEVKDPVLRCHLAVFCYMECPDEELERGIHREMMELKKSGRGEEIWMLEKMLEDIQKREAAVQ